MPKATVFYNPPVVLKGSWAADNGRETAVFPTQEEAIAFAWDRWRIPREQVRVVENGATNA